ncbi:MAG: HAMP domain-containing protein [Verrucomicrobia bacterium]|nr:HAMP domain-containing protein [Verrucomicrobiota bacterium]
MSKLFNTVAFRLAAGYAFLVIGAVALISALLYWCTVGVLDRQIDAKVVAISNRLVRQTEANGTAALQTEIQQLLTDNIDQDTEDYLLLDADGKKIIGNLAIWPVKRLELGKILDLKVTRNNRPSHSRVILAALPDGSTLIVGRDLEDRQEIKTLIVRALCIGGAGSILVTIAGAILFRRQLEQRIGTIRHMVLDIEAGDLSRRIPVSDSNDEFSRLNRELNHLLDQIQHLMMGVQDVSNAIAHDLRTPLGRIRNLLEESIRCGTSLEKVTDRAVTAIQAIDDVIAIFDKLLQIAEAEAGTRRQSFQPVSLREIVTDIADLYDATAEEKGSRLLVEIVGEPVAIGDKDLLASATANLVDNALKYAGDNAKVRVKALREEEHVSIVVQDDGPGIPVEEQAKVLTRFYRIDRSRSQPGNGLGLTIVKAICHLHGGTLSLKGGIPGLIVRIDLPRADISTLPNSNLLRQDKMITANPSVSTGTTVARLRDVEACLVHRLLVLWQRRFRCCWCCSCS